MTNRQSFNDFLASGAGPSTPRGRGRGRGRGGTPGSGGRGGRGGFGGGNGGAGGKSSFKADYTNMPFNYDAINSQKYTKMEGFSVQPFGPSPSPSGLSTPDGRGRGRGRGGYTPGGTRFDNNSTRGGRLDTPSRSGTATPVHGLGFHDKSPNAHRGGLPHIRGALARSTVGRGIGTGDVTWGGGKAPLFVKAGELFKDGEVDVITMDQDHHIHVEAMPLSDPSAPQMTDLRDEIEIEIIDQRSSDESANIEDDDDIEEQEQEQEALADRQYSAADIDPTIARIEAEETFVTTANTDLGLSNVFVTTQTADTLTFNSASEPVLSADIEDNPGTEQQNAADDDVALEEEAVLLDQQSITGDEELAHDTSMFYIDTEPSVSQDVPVPTYEAVFALPLGSGPSRPRAPSPEEEILFVPKSYRQPEPISVPFASVSRNSPSPSPPRQETEFISRAFINPRAMSRAQKKAAKRDKRRGNRGGKNRRKEEAAPRDDSDIEWGSDGPPPVILDVQGAVALDADEGEDVRILRDYMAGTMLNAQQESGSDEEKVAGEEDDEEEAEEMDLEAMRLFGAGIKGLTETGEMVIDEDDNDEEEWASDDSAKPDEEDEDEDEGSSSDLGDLEGILDLSDSDEEGEDVDVEELFKGKSQWTNETDWFINTLESALDGDVDMKNLKDRNKLFKSIENGDFGEDWNLEPVKKNKKNKHIPPELQAQWEKDRQRKAEKKKQRELERLIEEIDLSRSSKKGKGKSRGKGDSLAQQAALAHLIPASAAEIAEMFDVSSDEEIDIVTHRRRGLLPTTSVSLFHVDERIQLFLDDREKNSLALPPMDKEGRQKVHMLAECYGLKSKSRGGGKARFTVLIKNKHSGRQINHKMIERILTASQANSQGGFYKALHSRGSGNPNKFASSKQPGKSRQGQGNQSARAREGELVGEGAEKIGMENIGHRLLSKMGWAEGDRIGRVGGGGLDQPIIAIVKNTKAGLGA